MNLPHPDPFAPVALWSSPDFRADDWPEQPLYAFLYQEIAEHCAAALSSRVKSYPDLIAKGVIAESEAAADIKAWELLSAEWQWISTGDGKLPSPGSLAARRAAVELALERITQAFDRGDRRHDLYRQAHLNLALRWHLHRLTNGTPAVHHLAALSRELRAEAAAKRSIAA